jgi:hypothetical protein
VKFKITAALAATVIAVLLASPAEAKHHLSQATITCNQYGCNDRATYRAPTRIVRETVRHIERAVESIVGGRPRGCPHAFCGCGTSLHIFGRIIPELNLAANWRRFPPAAPARGMAAWRWGHVFAIEEVLGDGEVLAYDPNSGHGRTRIHVVSLRGFHVVNPHG